MDRDAAYRAGDVARMAGTTVRSLHHYEAVGLLRPARDPENGYRVYRTDDIDRLQEILLYRRLGMPLSAIKELLDRNRHERAESLEHHLRLLKAERRRLDELIRTVETSIQHEKGIVAMTDEEKFEGLKRALIEDNERTYGHEVRERYGNAAADESIRRLMNMTQADYAQFQELENNVLEQLEAAVTDGADAAGPEGARICALHREWLGFTWPSYSPEAHRGLADGYLADERFRAYYDRTVPGCRQWLRDAICAHAK